MASVVSLSCTSALLLFSLKGSWYADFGSDAQKKRRVASTVSLRIVLGSLFLLMFSNIDMLD